MNPKEHYKNIMNDPRYKQDSTRHTFRFVARNAALTYNDIREMFTGYIDILCGIGHDYDVAAVTAGGRAFTYLQGYFTEDERKLMDWWQQVFNEYDLVFSNSMVMGVYGCFILDSETTEFTKDTFRNKLQTYAEFSPVSS